LNSHNFLSLYTYLLEYKTCLNLGLKLYKTVIIGYLFWIVYIFLANYVEKV